MEMSDSKAEFHLKKAVQLDPNEFIYQYLLAQVAQKWANFDFFSSVLA